MVSQEIYHFKYDHHLVSTDGSGFHANHINLGIWMIYVTAGKSPEILGTWLAKSRAAMTRRWTRESGLGRAWYNSLRDIAKRFISLILR
jgi:hypothetical protein